jgi:hypothetical protein
VVSRILNRPSKNACFLLEGQIQSANLSARAVSSCFILPIIQFDDLYFRKVIKMIMQAEL